MTARAVTTARVMRRMASGGFPAPGPERRGIVPISPFLSFDHFRIPIQ
jgi:hypothetical protein